MKVRDAMTRDVRLVKPEQTIREAAQVMGEIDAGSLPVSNNDRLVGMITDRDIAVRAVAAGKAPDTKVADVMTEELLYCFEDEELEEVSRNMGDVKVRRMPVVNRDKRLVGIISLGDLAKHEDASEAGHTMSDIARPGGQHSQTVRH